jgi:hypothetical protein
MPRPKASLASEAHAGNGELPIAHFQLPIGTLSIV